MASATSFIQSVLFVSVILLGKTQSDPSTLRDFKFTKQASWCGLDISCFASVLPVSSKLECLLSCTMNTSCEVVLHVPSDSKCYSNYLCDVDLACTDQAANHDLYLREGATIGVTQTTSAPSCLNGGQFDSQTGTCDCSSTQGYGGDNCEHLLSSCQDLRNNGVTSGHHAIAMDLFGDGSVVFQTHCVMTSWSASFTVMRSSGRAAKNLSWDQYVNGFRLSDEDYWLGLENLHRYTSDGSSHRARFGASFNSSQANGQILESSSNFVVGSASNGYAYTTNSFTNRLSEIVESGQRQYFQTLLYGQSGKPFSTTDNDQDNNGLKHCAQLAGAGWWFGTCEPFSVNPLGWSYAAMPGATSDSRIRLPGVDMSQSSLAEGFQRVYLTLDL
ncbi:angiopoietin-related protein 4 [Elysia marginata]|uniref:Angiopoietin-related protein 4 n=1 Tax=Elysia marginata TaxID=1093978 RepID=A0AAV4J0H9_9GAST|nr:angiopoietin-related protein 4 [Elysia marginata]